MQKNPRIIDVLTEDQRKFRRRKIAAIIPFLAVNITIAAGDLVGKIKNEWVFPLILLNAVLFMAMIYLGSPKKPRFTKRWQAAAGFGFASLFIGIIADNFGSGFLQGAVELAGALGCGLAWAMIKLAEKDKEVTYA